MQNQEYIPGVCNINTEEIALRKKAAYICGVITLVITVGVILFPTPIWLRAVVVFPAFLTAISFLQAQNKFCVAYGTSGKQNASEGSTHAVEVSEQDAHVDKKRSQTMNLQAAGIALVYAVIICLIP